MTFAAAAWLLFGFNPELAAVFSSLRSCRPC